jgi:hypothetical protein
MRRKVAAIALHCKLPRVPGGRRLPHGLYPFVSHAFAAVDEGQVGLLKVGNVTGTMSHY